MEPDGAADGTTGLASSPSGSVEIEDAEIEAAAQNLWRKDASVLYDLFISCALEWPALTVAWLPDEADEGCRLAIGMHTDGSDSNEVVVAELCCSVENAIGADPWCRWSTPDFGEAEGFGCAPLGGAGPLRAVARLAHPTEVNRVAPCPQRPQLLASKTATGEVLLFDYKAERPAPRGQGGPGEARPDATLAAPGNAGVDGFALGWSPLQRHLLASGGNDGRMCVWDVEVATGRGLPCALLHDREAAHTGPLCDLGFSRMQPVLVATVGDDRMLRLWDMREGSAPQAASAVSDDDVLAVDWSHHREQILATAGKDRMVQVWDLRHMKSPLHLLKGHKDDAVVVRWAPCRDNLLASCSADSHVNIWDLAPKQERPPEADQADDEIPELLFCHGGHSEAVSDFSWSGTDDFLLCSVGEDNQFQVWQPSGAFYLEDSDAESAEQPPAKRTRTGGGDE